MPTTLAATALHYRVKDETLESNLATVSISVTPINDAPLAVDATLATTENNAAVINLLAGASDVDSSALTPVIVDGPLHGVLVNSQRVRKDN